MATTDPNKVKPSRVETILMAMLGESVEIDEPKSRVEELLRHNAQTVTDVHKVQIIQNKT